MRKLLLFLFINIFSQNIFCDDFYISNHPFAPSGAEGAVSRGDDLRNFLNDGHEVRKNFSEKLRYSGGNNIPAYFILSDHKLSAANYIHLAYLSHDEIF